MFTLKSFTYYWIMFLPLQLITIVFADDTDNCKWEYGYIIRPSFLGQICIGKVIDEIGTRYTKTRKVFLSIFFVLITIWDVVACFMFIQNRTSSDDLCNISPIGEAFDAISIFVIMAMLMGVLAMFQYVLMMMKCCNCLGETNTMFTDLQKEIYQNLTDEKLDLRKFINDNESFLHSESIYPYEYEIIRVHFSTKSDKTDSIMQSQIIEQNSNICLICNNKISTTDLVTMLPCCFLPMHYGCLVNQFIQYNKNGCPSCNKNCRISMLKALNKDDELIDIITEDAL